MVKICKICNKEFNAKGTATTCSIECRKINKKQQNSKDYENRKQKIVIEQDNRQRVSYELSQIAIEAREMGLSYGEYVSLLMGAGNLNRAVG